MNDDFTKMSVADLQAIKEKADRSLRAISEATALKNQSAAVLQGFYKAIEDLAKASVHQRRAKESRDSYEKWTVSLVTQESPLAASFERMLVQLASSHGDVGPFGAVPMKEFWGEWAESVGRLTALMVNRYAAKYVVPIPIDTVENIEAYKVGQKITEAATPGP